MPETAPESFGSTFRTAARERCLRNASNLAEAEEWVPAGVFAISLKRRPERLARLNRNIRIIRWPFRQPELFNAIDGRLMSPPEGWPHSDGAWGCRLSHIAVLKFAIERGLPSVLVIEDDAEFSPNFALRVQQFVRRVPSDWQGLMFGGDHEGHTPERIVDGVVRCVYTVRFHCYALRGPTIQSVHNMFINSFEHVDVVLANHMSDFRIYAPDPFLVAQAPNLSDIDGRRWMESRFVPLE